MGGLLVGLDCGTGSAKAVVVDEEGKILAQSHQEYPLYHDYPGHSEHDAEGYWNVSCQLLSQVTSGLGSRRGDIRAIALSSALPSLVVVDDAGTPVARGMNLLDRRAVDEVALVKDLVGSERLLQVTANRVEDHPSLVNLLWLKRHRPEVYRRAAAALTIDGFLVRKLTGSSVVNFSAGAFYGVAYDIRKGAFQDDILELLGLDREKLPEVVEPTVIVGEVGRESAAVTGLPVGTPVLGGQVDCNAAWVAGGAVEPGDMQLNLGTSGVLGVVHTQESFLSSEVGSLMVNIPYTTSPRDVYSAVAVTATGGQTLRYLRDVIGSVELEVQRVLGLSAFDLLTMQAAGVPPGSEGLLVLPYLMGERAPLWDEVARGVIFGLSLHHTRGHLVRATMEGVGFALRMSFEMLRRGNLAMHEPLVFNEGGAKSVLWRRIVTDILKIPSVVLESGTGAPFGDAILAGVGIGLFRDFNVAKQFARLVDEIEPDPVTAARYDEYFDLFQSIYESVQEKYWTLHRLMGAP